MSNLNLQAPVAAEKVNSFIVEAFTVALLVVGGLLTFVSVAAAAYDVSSSGQRARGEIDRGSDAPVARRSSPAHAIIAALSVQSAGAGILAVKPRSAASPARRDPMA